MLMRYRNCGQCLPANGMSLDYIIYTLCALIQHERNLIIEMDIPDALRDLFLEQSKIGRHIGLFDQVSLLISFVLYFSL